MLAIDKLDCSKELKIKKTTPLSNGFFAWLRCYGFVPMASFQLLRCNDFVAMFSLLPFAYVYKQSYHVCKQCKLLCKLHMAVNVN